MRSQIFPGWPFKEISSEIQSILLAKDDASSKLQTGSTSQGDRNTTDSISLQVTNSTLTAMTTTDTSPSTPLSPAASPSLTSQNPSQTLNGTLGSMPPFPTFPRSLPTSFSTIQTSPSLTSAPSLMSETFQPSTPSSFAPVQPSNTPASVQNLRPNQTHKEINLKLVLPVALTGGLLLLILLTLTVVYSCRKRKRRRSETPSPLSDEDNTYTHTRKEDEVEECDGTSGQGAAKDNEEADLATNSFRYSESSSGLEIESDVIHKDREYNMGGSPSEPLHSRANSTTTIPGPRGRRTPHIEIHVQKHQEYYSDDDIRSLSHLALSRQSSPCSIISTAPLPPSTASPFLSKVIGFSPSSPRLVRSKSKVKKLEEAVRVQPVDARPPSSHSQRKISSSPSPSALFYPTVRLKSSRGFDTMGSDIVVTSDYPYVFESNDTQSFSHRMKSADGIKEGSPAFKEEENEIVVDSIQHSSASESLPKVDTGCPEARIISSDQVCDSNSTLTPSFVNTAISPPPPPPPPPSSSSRPLLSLDSTESTTMTSLHTRDSNEVSNNMREVTHALNEKHRVLDSGDLEEPKYVEQGEDDDEMTTASIARFSPDFSVKTVYAI